MLYILDLQVEQTTKETIFGEREISGSLTTVSASAYYINTIKQTKLVDAADETEARTKIETYYTGLNTESFTNKVTVLSINQPII
jgi:hypothetical protein